MPTDTHGRRDPTAPVSCRDHDHGAEEKVITALEHQTLVVVDVDGVGSLPAVAPRGSGVAVGAPVRIALDSAPQIPAGLSATVRVERQ